MFWRTFYCKELPHLSPYDFNKTHVCPPLKLNIQKTKIVAPGPISSWQRDRETMETVTNFILLGSKITADGDCSHEIKRCLLLGRKAITNLDSVFKRRGHFANKGLYSQTYGFPVILYRCESWTIRRLSLKESMLLNCGVGEDSWESLGLPGDPTSPFWRRSAVGFLWKEWC